MKKSIYLFAMLMSLSVIGYSQCYPDRHSTNFFDGWISCEPSTNPNPARPVSHFIMYDYGKVYSLGQVQLWNTNDPAHLDWGMKDVSIDYSVDSVQWLHAGDFTFGQASGLSIYEGEQGPDLEGIEARYLLITALSNYGGQCYGMSEFKVEGTEVIISNTDDIAFDCGEISIYPNPFADKITLSISQKCEGKLFYSVYDAFGRQMISESVEAGTARVPMSTGSDLPPGSYMLHLQLGDQSIQKNIIKVNRF